MPEGPLAEGFVTIIPDFTQFDALLQAHVTSALAQIQAAQAASTTSAATTTVASSAPGLAAAAPGFAAIQTQASAAANAVTGQLTPALNSVTPAIKNVKTASDDAGVSLKNLQSQFNGIAKLAPLLVAGLSIKAFADFQKAAETSTTVFGDSSTQIVNFAKGLSTQFGLTQAQILNATNQMGQAFSQFGFSQDVAATASEELVKRAGDVAAAFGTPIQTVLKGFGLALEGNTRILKPIGIDISALDQKNQALKDGFTGTVAALTDGQKAFVNQQLILQDSAKFIGEAARQGDNLSQSFAQLKVETIDTAKNLGESLAPSALVVTTLLEDLLKVIDAIPGPIKAVAEGAAIAAVSIKALTAAFGFLDATLITPAIEGVATAFVAVETAAAGVTGALATMDLSLLGLGAAAAETGAALLPVLGPVGIVAAGIFAFENLANSADHAKISINDLATAGTTQDLKQKFISSVEGSLSLSQQLQVQFGSADDVIGVFIQQARKKIADLFAVDPNAAKDLANSFDPEGPVGKSLREKIVELSSAAADLTQRQKEEAAAFGDTGISASDAATQLQALFTSTGQLASATQALTDAQNRSKDIQEKINTLTAEGGKQELIDAQDKLTNATDAHAQALARQKAAQEALDALEAPATQRELTDATDAVTLAQLNLNDALRAQKAAQDALNKTNEIHLDLTGKSLAQIRDAIDNARATASANTTVSQNKTPAQLQDDLTKANIGVTTATEAVTDAQNTLNDTINKGNTAKLTSKDTIDKITQANYNLVQANNAVLSTQGAQDKAQFELNQKLAGQTNYATTLKGLQKDLTSSKQAEQDAQKKITDDTAKQKDDLNTILGITNTISNVLKQNLLDNANLFAGNTGLQTQVIKDVIAQLGGQLDPNANFQLTGLGPANILKLFNAIQGDPSSFKQLLKQFGVSIPGFAEGSVVHQETFARVGENNLAELILPLTKPDRAWDLLAQSLPHMTLPLRQKLEPVIHPEVTRSLGHVQTTQVAITGVDDQMQQVIDLLKDIAERTSGDVDLNIYPTAGMNERQLTEKIRQEFIRLMGGR